MLLLQHIRVENFKSLEKVELGFNPRVTLLVGRNNSGKSNVIEALVFLRDLSQGGTGVLSSRGGYRALVFARNPSLIMKFELSFDLDDSQYASFVRDLKTTYGEGTAGILEGHGWGRTLVYQLSIAGDNSFSESLDLVWEGKTAPLVRATFDARGYTWREGDVGSGIASMTTTNEYLGGLSPGSTVGGVGFTPVFQTQRVTGPIIRFLAALLGESMSSLVLRIRPNRAPSATAAVGGPTSLNDDGSNLAGWLHYLSNNNKRLHRELVGEFRMLVPEVAEVSTPLVGGNSTTASLEESSFEEGSGFDLSMASDGEKNLLVLLGHLVERRRFVVLAIEEPENGIHPMAQRLLARTIWRFSEGRETLLSTHSASLASCFPLDSLRLVQRKEAASRVTSLDAGNVRLVVDELGLRPGDILDQDIVAFVEGETDAKVFAAWLNTLRRAVQTPELAGLRCLFVPVSGLTNIPFYVDARILGARTTPPRIVAIVDGDTSTQHETQDQWKLVRARLRIDESRIHSLQDGCVIEDYLLAPEAIVQAYPLLFASSKEVVAMLPEARTRGRSSKKALEGLFAAKMAWYSSDVAERIAVAMKPEEIPEDARALLMKLAEQGTA